MKGTPEERFWAKVHKTYGCEPYDCWLWAGATRPIGPLRYGCFTLDGRQVMAHRFSYELAHGPIPVDPKGKPLEIDHRYTCPKVCVHPEHLRVATRKQNSENLAGAMGHSKTGIRGVYWAKDRGLWRGQVWHNGKKYFTRRHVTSEEAGVAVVALRNKLFTHNDADRTPPGVRG